jgi:hypothetical protein
MYAYKLEFNLCMYIARIHARVQVCHHHTHEGYKRQRGTADSEVGTESLLPCSVDMVATGASNDAGMFLEGLDD